MQIDSFWPIHLCVLNKGLFLDDKIWNCQAWSCRTPDLTVSAAYTSRNVDQHCCLYTALVVDLLQLTQIGRKWTWSLQFNLVNRLAQIFQKRQADLIVLVIIVIEGEIVVGENCC